jgi:hypothetical protein
LNSHIIFSLAYTDNSGIQFYVGNTLRPYDIGGLTLGVDSTPSSLAIPPNVSAFSVDTYCPGDASLLVCFKSFDKTKQK